MKAQIITKVSKKTGKEYECLQVTIGDWTGLMFLQKYELLFVKTQLALQSEKAKVVGKDEVNASLFD